MSENYKKLTRTLRQLFEMDKADLDFGIYRIMNQKRDEINNFLENDLLPQVKEAFAGLEQGDKAGMQKELEAAIEQAKSFGAPDPENAPPVLEIKEKMASSVDITAMEQEVYSHLHTFFSRYYDKGDFISLRRYKNDTYAIPYEGEEVKLHWANADQYYIKSSEHLRDYAFTVKGDDDKSIRIKLLEADTEKDNTKAQNGDRRFVLDADNPLTVVSDELRIHFNYIPKPKSTKQETLNKKAVEVVFEQEGFDDWLAALQQKAPTEKNQKRTVLEKHLNDYTARNTFDYFIHKDLGGFLRRELDFYIKNEVLYLDDIDSGSVVATEQLLRKIKAIRSIAHKIITFVSQLEDFQKKLWLKKKFIVEAGYCVTMNHVPQELHEEVINCNAQWQEWIALGFLASQETERKKDALVEKPFMVIDTRFYNERFKDILLGALDDVDLICDGLLINSENSQSLHLLQERYKNKIQCIYIDPPYNTSDNAFLYKNTYKHSSWLSMMSNSISLSPSLMSQSGVFLGAIDDTEYANFKSLLVNTYGNENYVGTVAVEVNPAGQNIRPNVPARSHDYFHIFANDINKINMQLRGLTPQEIKQYKEKDETGRFYWDNLRRRGGNSRPTDRPKQWYPLYVKEDQVRVPKMTWNDNNKTWLVEDTLLDKEIEAWPIDPKGEKRIWRVNPDGAIREIEKGEIAAIQKAGRIEVSKKSRQPQGKKPKTLWSESKYSATTHGSKFLLDLLGSGLHFSYPKSIHLTTDTISSWADKDAIVLDYFAGSGTTGHATLNLNRNDNGDRKYILIEMGQYFNTVLKPRIQKIIYSQDWKNGKPKPDNDGNLNGISHCFKYLRLESYEDTLNNLTIKKPSTKQQSLLDVNPDLKEDYMLSYCLDMETKDSASLLSLEQFEDPFNYKLNIATTNVGATTPTNVDLVETFNYLLGLTVKQIDTIRGFKIVVGQNPQEESVLVVWRVLAEKDNAALEEFMNKSSYHPRDTEFDHIYVNGDHTLEDPNSKVKMTEIEFKRLMFDIQDV